MDVFTQRLRGHADHIAKVAKFCDSEETTKQALILPLLDILGFSAFDPSKVRAEFISDFPGFKHGEKVDYALFVGTGDERKAVMFIEAKAHSQDLNNHCPQLSRYFNATPDVAVGAITNGQEWRFFTDLENKNVMDSKPFLTIDFAKLTEDDATQLRHFHYDQFQNGNLRALAEEAVYLQGFRQALTSMLRDVDTDFVRYVANRSNIQRQFNQRFLEGIQPLVKQAVAQTISGMVATSLSTPAPVVEVQPQAEEKVSPAAIAENADHIDPENPNIITTFEERRLLETVQDVLAGEDIQGKDTESYFSITYQGKSNRWLVRFWADKKEPSIKFGIDLTDAHRAEISRAGMSCQANDQISILRPEHLYRLSGILMDVLNYAKNDENFRRTSKSAAAEE